jgi:NMD protein affecting ribosome stability and mRNA decay
MRSNIPVWNDEEEGQNLQICGHARLSKQVELITCQLYLKESYKIARQTVRAHLDTSGEVDRHHKTRSVKVQLPYVKRQCMNT